MKKGNLFIFVLYMTLALSLISCAKNSSPSSALPVTSSIEDVTGSPSGHIESDNKPKYDDAITIILPFLNSVNSIGFFSDTIPSNIGGFAYAFADKQQVLLITEMLLSVDNSSFETIEFTRNYTGWPSVELQVSGELGTILIRVNQPIDIEGFIDISILTRDGTDIPSIYRYPVETSWFSALYDTFQAVLIDTNDFQNAFIVYTTDDDIPEGVVPKFNSSVMKYVFDGTITNTGAFESSNNKEYDLILVFGDIIYMLDMTSGCFSRTYNDETVFSQLDEQCLLVVSSRLTHSVYRC